MVFNSNIVVSVAKNSAETWQNLLFTPHDRISTPQLLDLICCFPLQQFGRLALCLWSFFCFPAPDSYLTYSYYDSDDSDSSSFDYDYDYDDHANGDDDDDDRDHGRSFHYDSHSD